MYYYINGKGESQYFVMSNILLVPQATLVRVASALSLAPPPTKRSLRAVATAAAKRPAVKTVTTALWTVAV